MELKEGKVYYHTWHSNNPFIFMHTGNDLNEFTNTCYAIRINDKKFGKEFVFSRKCEYNNMKNLREATFEEENWLLNCIAANKYVEPILNQELSLIIW